MAIEFALPELGEGIDSAEVSRLYVSVGDTIEADQSVMELEAEKAVADLPCPHAGEVSEIHVSEGDTVKVGQTLLTVKDGGEKPSGVSNEAKDDDASVAKNEGSAEREGGDDAGTRRGGPRKHPEADSNKETESPEVDDANAQESRTEFDAPGGDRDDEEAGATTDADEGDADDAVTERKEDEHGPSRPAGSASRERAPAPAGPATRRLARTLGMDLDALRPSNGERITQGDVVRAFLAHHAATAGGPFDTAPDLDAHGATTRQSLGKVSRAAADRLTASWRNVPQVTQHAVADITELELERRRYLGSTNGSRSRITLTAIVLKALVGLLKEFPTFNSSLDSNSDELVLKEYYNIGVAVDTDMGLLVPVVRGADRKSVREMADEVSELADRARKRGLDAEAMQGGTFTLSNQGGIGGDHFTPIVNWPQVAILGLGRARRRTEARDGRPRERLALPLSLSYDHRVINGAEAARFVERLGELLSDSMSLLIDC